MQLWFFHEHDFCDVHEYIIEIMVAAQSTYQAS